MYAIKTAEELLVALRAQLKACEQDRIKLLGAIEGIELFITQLKQENKADGQVPK